MKRIFKGLGFDFTPQTKRSQCNFHHYYYLHLRSIVGTLLVVSISAIDGLRAKITNFQEVVWTDAGIAKLAVGLNCASALSFTTEKEQK